MHSFFLKAQLPDLPPSLKYNKKCFRIFCTTGQMVQTANLLLELTPLELLSSPPLPNFDVATRRNEITVE